MKQSIDDATVRRWAVEASADPRSVHKLLRGESVRGLAGHRIRAVLDAAGIIIPRQRRPEKLS